VKVWLIDHESGIPAATTSEGRQVRTGVQNRLQRWFNKVARHRNAKKGRPKGHRRHIEVKWGPAGSSAGPYDLALHFVPSQPGKNPPVMGPYREAALKIQNRELSKGLLENQRGFSGGLTKAGAVGKRRVPTLSMVIVLYDAQFSIESMRVETNVQKLSIISFHEAAHNKDRSDSLHRKGGGGIFDDIHTGGTGSATRPNRDNISFFAKRIWNWGPQYTVGSSMSPVSPP